MSRSLCAAVFTAAESRVRAAVGGVGPGSELRGAGQAPPIRAGPKAGPGLRLAAGGSLPAPRLRLGEPLLCPVLPAAPTLSGHLAPAHLVRLSQCLFFHERGEVLASRLQTSVQLRPGRSRRSDPNACPQLGLVVPTSQLCSPRASHPQAGPRGGGR